MRLIAFCPDEGRNGRSFSFLFFRHKNEYARCFSNLWMYICVVLFVRGSPISSFVLSLLFLQHLLRTTTKTICFRGGTKEGSWTKRATNCPKLVNDLKMQNESYFFTLFIIGTEFCLIMHITILPTWPPWLWPVISQKKQDADVFSFALYCVTIKNKRKGRQMHFLDTLSGAGWERVLYNDWWIFCIKWKFLVHTVSPIRSTIIGDWSYCCIDFMAKLGTRVGRTKDTYA